MSIQNWIRPSPVLCEQENNLFFFSFSIPVLFSMSVFSISWFIVTVLSPLSVVCRGVDRKTRSEARETPTGKNTHQGSCGPMHYTVHEEFCLSNILNLELLLMLHHMCKCTVALLALVSVYEWICVWMGECWIMYSVMSIEWYND